MELLMQSMDPGERIYCSGYWPLPGNQKRERGHYDACLPLTIQMLEGSALHFYSSDDGVLERVEELCSVHRIAPRLVRMQLHELPAWDLADEFVRCCERMNLRVYGQLEGRVKDKGVRHYWRDLRGSGADAYRSLLAIWLSKVDLAASLAEGLAGDCVLSWVDASLARKNHGRVGWDFTKIAIPRGKFCHYSSKMSVYGSRLPLSAGFLGAEASTWRELAAIYVAMRQRLIAMPYGHDEETILSRCQAENPALFHCIDQQQLPEPVSRTPLQRLKRLLRGFVAPGR